MGLQLKSRILVMQNFALIADISFRVFRNN